jgi:hypothetical protein
VKDKKFIIILSSLILALLIVYLVLNLPTKYYTTTDLDEILFEKIEGWGPCPPDTVCKLETKIYYSGKMSVSGQVYAEKELPENTILEIVKVVKDTNLMNKNCEAPIVLDYMATYKLNIDGNKKEIQFPGCEKEIRKIENLIPKVDQNLKGGA